MSRQTWQTRARRLHAQLGLPGYAGLLLMAVASAISWSAWQNTVLTQTLSVRLQAEEKNLAAQGNGRELETASSTSETNRWPALDSKADQVAILSRLEVAAQTQQLAWTKVDYALHDIGDSTLSSLEIRGVLKGDYPALRRFLNQALNAQPGMALRSLILQRDAPETRELEARISLVVFLRDGWLPWLPSSSASTASQGRRP
ncbi:MAG: hypothetical protein EOP38_22340 [Rubrivivax sp.]|nr:MAG: hypothetical protein EOP38_22340 [Rubrivivax sp.]